MFETKILNGSDYLGQSSTLEGGALRAFDWPELVARIAATNDLRRVVKNSGASFGDFAALATDMTPDETCDEAPFETPDQTVSNHARGNSKHAVNPNALGAGKTPSPKAVVDDEHATLGDRNNA